LLGKTL